MDAKTKLQYDRLLEDLGNVVSLEHVNTQIPDQQAATLFYIMGLGLTRDPYFQVGVENMWINIGRNQFHLPTRAPTQVLRGHVALIIPGREGLLARLALVKDRLDGTQFSYAERADHVEVISPWGNRIRCYEPDEQRFGSMQLGMPYVEFDVPKGTAEGIARFYREAIQALAEVGEDRDGKRARVTVGNGQYLVFRETDKPIPAFDGHHVQIYVADFSTPYRWLKERGLVFQESNQHGYRFKDIVDPQSGQCLFVLDHEVRSLKHPMYARPLVNREIQPPSRMTTGRE